jgi:hypothetical protein
MELDLQSLSGLLCTAVLIGRDPATPPLPPHWGSYTRALLVSQDRRHLFLTPWVQHSALYKKGADSVLINYSTRVSTQHYTKKVPFLACFINSQKSLDTVAKVKLYSTSDKAYRITQDILHCIGTYLT